MSDWWEYENLESGHPYDWSPAQRNDHPDDNIDFHVDLGAGNLPKGRLTIDRHGDADVLMDLNSLVLRKFGGVTRPHTINSTVNALGTHYMPGDLKWVEAKLPFPDNSIESMISHHCSPFDEPILTTEGYVPIGELNNTLGLASADIVQPPQANHRIASMNKCLTWGGGRGAKYNSLPIPKRGFDFDVASRYYRGELLSIETSNSKTRVTPNHILPIKFNEDFWNEKWITYLMRRGNWWRVGMVTNNRGGAGKSWGLLTRRNHQKADAVWILGIHNSKKEAVLEEERIQSEYGITGFSFESGSTTSFSKQEIYEFHNSMNFADKAQKLLSDKGLLEDYPLISNGEVFRSAFVFDTAAANISTIKNYCYVLTSPNDFSELKSGTGKAELMNPVLSSDYFEGEVYSLDVPPHHYYVSGNAVVHNCLEHIGDGFIRLMDECYRVLKPGAKFRIIVPLFPSFTAVDDPEHNRYFCKDTFEAFCHEAGPETPFWYESCAPAYTKCRFHMAHKEYTPAQSLRDIYVREQESGRHLPWGTGDLTVDDLFKQGREIRVTLLKPE